jgi:hypothetical protein
LVTERDETLDGLPFALEDGLDGPVGVVPSPAGYSELAGAPPDRVTKVDTLDESVDDDAAANHRM